MSTHNLQQTQHRINTVFNIFAHHRRRYAIRELQRYEGAMALADLANEIAVREKETALTDIPADEVKQIYMSLYHNHLPKLAEAGFVRYDQDQDLVTLTVEAKQLGKYKEYLTIG